MCENCGCGHVESFKVLPMQEPPIRATKQVTEDEAHHFHLHEIGEPHSHAAPELRTVAVHLPLLAKNDRLAERNRGFLAAKGVYAINIVSSPGSGKTTFIANTLERLNGKLPAAVIVGDLETANDAMRLRGKGAPVVQVTTGTVCHLDAEMVFRGIEALELGDRRLLIPRRVNN